MGVFGSNRHLRICVIICFSIVAGTHSLQCLGRNGKYECCNGYMWNETLQNCDTRCLPGYFGNNCTRHCSPGRYGEGCSNLCTECDVSQCNVSFGCPVSTTEIPTPKIRVPEMQELNKRSENVSMESLPKSNSKIPRENAQDIPWKILSVAFSIATFAVVLLYIAKRSCKKPNIVMAPKENSKVTWPSNIVDGSKLGYQNYQPLHNESVFNGTANVTINMDTEEKNFTVILKTDQNDGRLNRHHTTEPKRNMGNSINENGKIYESYINREI
ncbi:uncharacterized protein LOC133203840 isoform X1 [Saccostrea echinata]|uniref:uncharacterized protein LOC133203840 isoform X1 n=1 Tax=Saccostrea echinata TaxID=191078 RepID=UPI002A838E5F|nr:uncharacterized protein LOC133203840 isoform X1 [Saccostrea echinata]